jgi:GWxTD domain-containing protein
MRIGCITLAAACAFAAGAAADDGFYYDYAPFYPSRGGDVVVEVYVAVPLERLTSSPSEGGDVYNFNVGARATRLADGAVVANRLVSRTATVAAGEGNEAPLSVTQVNVGVPPGDYRLSVGVGDLSGGGTRSSEVGVAIAAPPAEGPFVSGIKLASSIAPVGEDVAGEFIKNGLSVIPNPTKLVSDSDPALPIYYEIYRLPVAEGEAETFVLRYDVSQLNGRRFVRVERLLEVEASDVVRVETLDLTGVPPGSYRLSVFIDDREGGEMARAEKDFMIYHEYSQEELVQFKGKFMPYSLEEEKQIRKELSLIASDAELAAFDALPAEEKPIFVDNFWARRDPDKETATNEYKNAFYQRYYYVQERYSTPFREGVVTDMGRIYLKYGEPDQVSRSPMGMRSEVTVNTSTWQSKPFEAWEYLDTGGVDNQNIIFVFIDDNGDGDYEIDSSTVPGYGSLIRSR